MRPEKRGHGFMPLVASIRSHGYIEELLESDIKVFMDDDGPQNHTVGTGMHALKPCK